jgi:hypothetical protein
MGTSFVFLWGVQAIYQWLVGTPTNPLKWLSLIVFLVGTLLVAAGNLLWRKLWTRFPALNRIAFPDLHGTWEGTLVSTWIDPTTNKPLDPIPVKFWITQNLFDVLVRMRTGESVSYSTRHFAEANRGLQVFRIWYSYENRPNAQYVSRSARHEGIAWMEVDLATEPQKLRGQYYTDRKTSGDIEIERVNAEVV